MPPKVKPEAAILVVPLGGEGDVCFPQHLAIDETEKDHGIYDNPRGQKLLKAADLDIGMQMDDAIQDASFDQHAVDDKTETHSGSSLLDGSHLGRGSDIPGGIADRTIASDSTVAKRTVAKRTVAKPVLAADNPCSCDSTVAEHSNVLSFSGQKRKASATVLSQRSKKRNQMVEPAPRPKPLTGHEWRRQGTGWTLLRSWYERSVSGVRIRKREYVQHYSASALSRAESLRRAL